MDLETLTTKYQPKQMVAIPLIVFILALLILGVSYVSTGSPVKLGIEFTGGTVITVPTTETEDVIADKLVDYPVEEIRKFGNRYMVQFGPMSDSDYRTLAEKINSEYDDAEIRYMGPVYSEGLQKQALRYIPMAFLFMAVVVFAIFRTPFISLIIVLSALSDIMIASACMNITGIELSLGTVAALLMLIGYSVDSNILLTTRVLKRKGIVVDKVIGAMKTGISMTTTTLSAIVVLFFVSTFSYLVSSSFSRIDILSDISIVLIFGLLADLMNTWIMNASALRWYTDRTAARRPRR